MSTIQILSASIAQTINDYRAGEIPAPTALHVENWINQFDPTARLAMLAELDHIFKRTYIPRTSVESFLSTVATSPKLAGNNPHAFWRNSNFLNIQRGGNSQQEMLQMFDQVLQKQLGLQLHQCGNPAGDYFYLDDIIFSGNRVRRDLENWIEFLAPPQAQVHIVVIAYHLNGQNYANQELQKAIAKSQKAIKIKWWRLLNEIEDRRTYINNASVLRPSTLPNNPSVQAYASGLAQAGFPPIYRTPGTTINNPVFSSEAGRNLLEEQFLIAGTHIRTACPYLKEAHRPLGYSVLKTLGFGSLHVTFRNCPNNTPLAFWVDKPWYPLFPRKTN